jgi:quercetin dioxygenase-like cupin family protein
MKIANIAKLEAQSVSHNPSIHKKVIARKDDIPHITQIAQTIIKAGDIVEGHAHTDLYEVFYIENGVLTIIVNGEESIQEAGAVITIEPGDTHQFENNSTGDARMFYFGIEKN